MRTAGKTEFALTEKYTVMVRIQSAFYEIIVKMSFFFIKNQFCQKKI